MGKCKLFPGGPTCMFKGKVVPWFTRWSESGGVSSTILKEFFETINHFQLLPRTPGFLPFVMLDGHGSRLELPFLKYINNKTTEWCVCLGVPYGTTYTTTAYFHQTEINITRTNKISVTGCGTYTIV